MITMSHRRGRIDLISLTPERMSALHELVHKMGLQDVSGFLRASMELMSWLTNKIQDGYDIGSLDKESKTFIVLDWEVIDKIRNAKRGEN